MSQRSRDVVLELYERYREPVYAYIRRRTQDGEVARDLSQEVYLRLVTMEGIEQIDHPRGLLYRIALNLVIDWTRTKRAQAERASLAFATEETASEFQSGERIALAEEGLQVLSRAIEELPPKCRRVFVLHRVHNLSHKEIAAKLGLSPRAIEKHLERGMQRVKEQFEQAFAEDRRGNES